MRGDLHSHTDWSDGRAIPRRDGLDGARAPAQRYLAVCDHAQPPEGRPAGAAGRGDRGGRRAGRRDLQISRGVEVDIRADGSAGHAGRRARRPRLGDGLHPLRLRPKRRGAHAADRGGDGEPARGLHRPSHREEDQPPRPLRRRLRGAAREGARDGDVPGDQLPARPARPGRQPCARGRGGRRQARHLDRRAPHARAREHAARRRAGAARLARPRPDRERTARGGTSRS